MIKDTGRFDITSLVIFDRPLNHVISNKNTIKYIENKIKNSTPDSKSQFTVLFTKRMEITFNYKYNYIANLYISKDKRNFVMAYPEDEENFRFFSVEDPFPDELKVMLDKLN